MTIREKLADCLTDGAYSDAVALAKFSADELVKKHNMAVSRWDALRAIEAATSTGKSGTARKINRMAMEALE